MGSTVVGFNIKARVWMISLLGFCASSHAIVSPIRKPGRSFESYLQPSESISVFSDKKPKRNTVSRNSVHFEDAPLVLIPEFRGTQAEFTELFRYIRDERFFADPASPSFKRRIPWLFPDDGCPVRAEWVTRKIHLKNEREQFSKLFLFGDLELATEYHPDGKLLWWYHVAAAIRFEGVPYVFDPSVDPDHPLSVSDWSKKLAGWTTNTRIAICSGGALDPTSLCDEKPFHMSSLVALKTLHELLRKERMRVRDLGLNASQVLGDHPPWLTH